MDELPPLRQETVDYGAVILALFEWLHRRVALAEAATAQIGALEQQHAAAQRDLVLRSMDSYERTKRFCLNNPGLLDLLFLSPEARARNAAAEARAEVVSLAREVACIQQEQHARAVAARVTLAEQLLGPVRESQLLMLAVLNRVLPREQPPTPELPPTQPALPPAPDIEHVRNGILTLLTRGDL